jgi:hypothetical protein
MVNVRRRFIWRASHEDVAHVGRRAYRRLTAPRLSHSDENSRFGGPPATGRHRLRSAGCGRVPTRRNCGGREPRKPVLVLATTEPDDTLTAVCAAAARGLAGPWGEPVLSARAAGGSARGNVLGAPVGPVVVAELDEAAPLARGLDCMVRRPVVVPSVAHKTAHRALDVHELSVSACCPPAPEDGASDPGRGAKPIAEGEPAGAPASGVAGGRHEGRIAPLGELEIAMPYANLDAPIRRGRASAAVTPGRRPAPTHLRSSRCRSGAADVVTSRVGERRPAPCRSSSEMAWRPARPRCKPTRAPPGARQQHSRPAACAPPYGQAR